MAGRKTSPDADVDKLQGLIRAGIGDLTRLTKDDPTGLRSNSRLPEVPQAAQISMLLLLLMKGVERKHRALFTHRERLVGHLDKVYRRSKACWEEALTAKNEQARDQALHDTSGIKPAVTALDRFANKSFGVFTKTLGELGVNDVQVTLGALIKSLTDGIRQDLGLADPGKSTLTTKKVSSPGTASREVPPQILGGLLAASFAHEVATQDEISSDQAKALRVAVFISRSKPDPKKAKPASTKRVTRTLEGLANHIRSLK